MDMVLKANDAFIGLMDQDLHKRKWSWNTSVQMVNIRLHEEREKQRQEGSLNKFRTRSLTKRSKYHQCRLSLTLAIGSLSTREPETYSVDKFIKLPKKERHGVLEDLANNFFSTSEIQSKSNSSRISKAELCIAKPIETNQYSIRCGDEALANIFSTRLSQIVGNPALPSYRKMESFKNNEDCSLAIDVENSMPGRFQKHFTKEEPLRYSVDNIKDLDVCVPHSTDFFHKRSKSEFPLSTAVGSPPFASFGSGSMTTTLVNEKIQFTPSCFHKKLKAKPRRKPTLPNLNHL